MFVFFLILILIWLKDKQKHKAHFYLKGEEVFLFSLESVHSVSTAYPQLNNSISPEFSVFIHFYPQTYSFSCFLCLFSDIVDKSKEEGYGLMHWNAIFSENRVLLCLQDAKGLQLLHDNLGVDNKQEIDELFETIEDLVGFCRIDFLTKYCAELRGMFGCRIEEL